MESELTEQEEALLDCAVQDWYGLVEFGQNFTIHNPEGSGRPLEVRGPTKATLLSLHSKGLVQFAYLRHYVMQVRMPGPHQPPDVRDIAEGDVEAILNDPAAWEGRERNEEAVEFTATPQGEEMYNRIWRQRLDDSS
jgi:hypothetical protein